MASITKQAMVHGAVRFRSLFLNNNNMNTKNTRLESLKNAEKKLSDLKNSPTATAEQIQYAEYVVALKIGILHDMDGMSN